MNKLAGLCAIAFPLLLALDNCAPEPRVVSCENDAMCHEAASRFHYCAQSHCVECVTNAECEYGKTCRGGFCKAKSGSAGL